MTRRFEIGPAAPLIGFVLLFAVVPAALLFASSLGSAGGWAGFERVVSDPLNERAMENSLEQGGLSALAAVAAGYPVGVLIGRFDWPGRSAVRSLLLVPFLLPSIVIALGIEGLFGPGGSVSAWLPGASVFGGGIGAIVAANVYFNAPLVALLTAIGVESASPELEEAVATLGGGGAVAYRTVWGPPSWRGALAGGLLTFLFSALAFAAPLILCGPRCYTLEARVWTLDQQLIDPVSAGVLALSMVVVLALPTAAYLYLVAYRRASGDVRSARRRPHRLRGWAGWSVAVVAAAILALIAGLLGSILWEAVRAASPGHPAGSGFATLFGPSVGAALGISTSGALVNTLLFALGASVIALLLALPAGHVLRRSTVGAQGLGGLVFLPLLVSPIVLSFSLATFYRPLLGGESTVWLLIILSQATIALPLALQSLSVGLRRVPVAHSEAAQTLGSGPFAAYLDVELPQVRSSIVAASLLAFAIGLGEFTATYFLATPRFTTLTVELYRLETIRAVAAASALAGLLVVVSAAAFIGVGLAGEHVEL
ncbi:MAG: ABC transporter permease subunit [Thermoplasmata archaeon]|nr:ABC transporter permease subunit [Thermoplasmata archaeon]